METTSELATYQSQAPTLLSSAEQLTIQTDADLTVAAELAKGVSLFLKGIKGIFTPMKQAADKAKKEILDQEKKLLAPGERADVLIRAKIADFGTRRLQLAQAEQRRKQDEERKRREDEQVQQAAQLENLAHATQDPHYQQAAEQVLAAPVREAVIPLEMPKPRGITFREETGVEVFDLQALVGAVATGKAPTLAVEAATW